MDNAFSPREIQARIRSGASVSDVVSESGLDVARIKAFAEPMLAEREHIAGSARTSTIRRRGETGSHRKLGDLIAQRLRARGVDDDQLTWDAWRQADLKWRVLAVLPGEIEDRRAEFVFDAKGRFSVADNADARWMIGEEQVGARPEEENTVDLNDELALVRAVAEPTPEAPGEDVPASDLMHDGNEDPSQLDRLYDMLSGISEDSVRIYTGFFDDAPSPEPTYDEPVAADDDDLSVDDLAPEDDEAAAEADEAQEPVDEEPPGEAEAQPPAATVPTQEPLVEGGPEAPVKKPRKKRASIPSWDEIMFGGPA